MTDVTDGEKPVVDLDVAAPRLRALNEASNDELVELLAVRARTQGLQLTGDGGLLGAAEQAGRGSGAGRRAR